MSSSNGAKTSKQLLKQQKRVFQSKSEGNWKRTNAATHVVCHVQQQLDCRARHCKKNKKGNPGRIMIALGVWQTQTDREQRVTETETEVEKVRKGNNSLDSELTEQYVKSSWDWPCCRCWLLTAAGDWWWLWGGSLGASNPRQAARPHSTRCEF